MMRCITRALALFRTDTSVLHKKVSRHMLGGEEKGWEETKTHTQALLCLLCDRIDYSRAQLLNHVEWLLGLLYCYSVNLFYPYYEKKTENNPESEANKRVGHLNGVGVQSLLQWYPFPNKMHLLNFTTHWDTTFTAERYVNIVFESWSKSWLELPHS